MSRVILILILLTGCNCGLDKGDIVIDKLTGEVGTIGS